MSFHNMCYPTGEIVDLIEYQVKSSDVLRHSMFALIMVSCTVGLIGNAIVIFFTIFGMKKKKSKIWFLNLAINDFVALLLLPLHGLAVLHGDWSYGQHVCKLFLFAMSINLFASIFFLMAVSITRVLSVAKPMFHQKFISQHALRWTCTVIWIIALGISFPVLFFAREFKFGDNTYCTFLNFGDFDNSTFEPVSNLTIGHLNLQAKAHLDKYQKYYQFLMMCSSDECCSNEESIAKWDDLVFSVKCFFIPFVIMAYVLPMFVILFSNITIAIKVKQSQTVNPHRLYRIVISIIVMHFVTGAPAILAEIIFLAAAIERNLILMLKVVIFMPFLHSVAYTNCCLDPIIYVLVGRQTRTSLKNFLSRVRSS